MQFSELGIIPQILRAIEDEGYAAPSPIQEQTIPVLLENRDVLGCAQTGTGKTAAFAIPILQNISEIRKSKPIAIRALIMTPTRELALQIDERFSAYGKYLRLRSTVIYGGVSQVSQVKKLQNGVDIVVATPGRFLDLFNQGFIDLKAIEIFVLDEADHMLDMGFVHDIKKIIKLLPPNRQNLLFSATMPDEVMGLVKSILRNPVEVTVTAEEKVIEVIEKSLYFVEKAFKTDLLIDILKEKDFESTLVFSRTKHGADKIVKLLAKQSILAQAIHGNKSQNTRQATLDAFKSRKINVLVATDIAARGIDIDALSCVINYDLPEVSETFIHRIGRTARAGLGGVSISFCDNTEREYLKHIEKLIGEKLPIVAEHKYNYAPVAPVIEAEKQPLLQNNRAFKAKKRAPSQRGGFPRA